VNHAKRIGFAIDRLPIYGPNIYTSGAPPSGIKVLQSSDI
jgi:hypothetical protein